MRIIFSELDFVAKETVGLFWVKNAPSANYAESLPIIRL